MTSPTIDRRSGLVGNTAFKAPVTVVATGNITQSGQQTIDGVAVLATNSAGVPDRVLCTGMTDATKNGIWDVSTAAWTRSKDADGNYDLVQGSTVLATQGTANAGTYWRVSTGGLITIGTTALAWAQALASALSTSTFTQAGTGAVSRNGQTKMREVMSVADFGCVLDGVTDDQADYQKAITAAQTFQTALYLNAGVLLIGTAVSVTAALAMYGAGNSVSVVKLNTTTQNGISIATTAKITFSGFQVQGKNTASAGDLIRLDSDVTATNINQFASFRDMWFQGGWNQLNTVSASTWSVINCLFFSPLNTCVTIADNAHTDAGDMQIIGCIFSGQAGVGTAVSQNSAGGLRFIGNKVIQFANGYVLTLAAGVATSDLFICGNSMEAFTANGILLARGAGVVFGAVQITGNEISGALACINMSGDAGPWMSHMEIVGNNIGFSLGGTGIAIVGTQDFIIANNTISGSSTGTGINLGVVVSKGIITHNTILACTLPINNGSSATDIIIEQNPGYNPVGAGTVAAGASPWTFTNGPTRTTLYLAAVTSISAVSINTTSILPSATGANVNLTVDLGPNEVAQITYTGALTAKKMVH